MGLLHQSETAAGFQVLSHEQVARLMACNQPESLSFSGYRTHQRSGLRCCADKER